MSDQPKKPIKAMMVCAMGMSSSLLEIKTKEAAAKAGVPFEIKAVSVSDITRWDPAAHHIDIVLVAPQVFYKRKALEIVGERHGIIVQGINPMVFGMVDGDKLFEQILKAIKDRDDANAAKKPAPAADKPKETPKVAASVEAKAKEPAKDSAKSVTKAKEPAKDKPAKK